MSEPTRAICSALIACHRRRDASIGSRQLWEAVNDLWTFRVLQECRD